MTVTTPDPTPDPTPGDPGADGTPAPGRSYQQDEVDRIVGERLARERRKFADYADLKAAADRLAKIEEQQKTETQRLADQLAAAEKARDDAVAAATRAQVTSAVTAAAAGKLADPGDALALLDTAALVGDDGAVDTAALTAAIDALVTAKPYLAAAGPGPRTPAPDPSQGAKPGGTASKGSLDEQIAAAQKASDWRAVVSLNSQKLAAAART